jgi:hypothetical protein
VTSDPPLLKLRRDRQVTSDKYRRGVGLLLLLVIVIVIVLKPHNGRKGYEGTQNSDDVVSFVDLV